jgi:hypothetical protein
MGNKFSVHILVSWVIGWLETSELGCCQGLVLGLNLYPPNFSGKIVMHEISELGF